jgi:Sec-independent protein secretion pathway component TatC
MLYDHSDILFLFDISVFTLSLTGGTSVAYYFRLPYVLAYLDSMAGYDE